LSTTPVMLAMIQDECPDARAFATGTYLSLNFAIRSAAAIAFGAVGDAHGLGTAIVVGAIALLAGAPMVFLLPRRDGRAG
jgi:predicted MFS family arabinose efflux permease